VADGSCGPLKGAEASGFITLHLQLKALPTSPSILGYAPSPKRTMLPGPRNVTNCKSCGVLKYDWVSVLRLMITVRAKGQERRNSTL